MTIRSKIGLGSNGRQSGAKSGFSTIRLDLHLPSPVRGKQGLKEFLVVPPLYEQHTLGVKLDSVSIHQRTSTLSSKAASAIS
jgi:hypothetical protein